MQAKGIFKQDPDEYLGPKGMRMGSGEGSTKSNFIFCTVHHIVRVIKYRRLRWAGHVARMKEGRSCFKMLTGKPTGNRPVGRPRRRWEDNIRMDFKK